MIGRVLALDLWSETVTAEVRNAKVALSKEELRQRLRAKRARSICQFDPSFLGFAKAILLALLGAPRRTGVWLCFYGREFEFQIQRPEFTAEFEPALQKTQSSLAFPRIAPSSARSPMQMGSQNFAESSAKTHSASVSQSLAPGMTFFAYIGRKLSGLDQAMTATDYGVFEPSIDQSTAAEVWQEVEIGSEGELDVTQPLFGVFVPGLAFDRDLNRMGSGKGYYDRFLGLVSGVPWMGLGLVKDRVESVPMAPHDLKMDSILFEDEWVCSQSWHRKMCGMSERGFQ